MSLLVDPHSTTQKTTRPIGPSSIGFTRASEEEAGPSHLNNPYIQLSGLADCQRWPELLNSKEERSWSSQQWYTTTTTTALKYSETIVGPKGSGSGAGMRVSGRKSIRGSRQPPTITDLSLSLYSTTTSSSLRIIIRDPTRPRSQLSRGGLNPEDSDDDEENSLLLTQAIHQDQFKPISRKPTTTTLKTHRRRISAITLQLDCYTNTVVSSDFSEHANQLSIVQLLVNYEARVTYQTTTRIEERTRTSNQSISITSPFTTQPHLDDSETTKTDIYYSTEHDPDKRMKTRTRTAPLLEADNEDDTGEEDIETDQTDTGTEQGEDDSSLTMKRSLRIQERWMIICLSRVEDENLSNLIQIRSRTTTRSQTLIKGILSLINTFRPPSSWLNIDSSNPLTRTNTQSPDVLSSANGNQTGTATKGLGTNLLDRTSSGEKEGEHQDGKSVAPLAIVPKFHRASHQSQGHLYLICVKCSQSTGNTNSQEELSSQSSSTIINSFSPGRARALTTPTPIQASKSIQQSPKSERMTKHPAVNLLANVLLSLGIALVQVQLVSAESGVVFTNWQPSSRPISSSGLTAAPTPPPLSNQEPKTVTTEPIITNTPSLEDDGEVDDDFPALDRIRPAAKVGSNEFAIVMVLKLSSESDPRRPSRVLGDPKRAPRGSIEPVEHQQPIISQEEVVVHSLDRPFILRLEYLLRERCRSINTTLNVTMDMYLADVLESLVKKNLHQRDIVVPLDRTVQSLQGVNSLALVKRSQLSSKLLRNTQLNSNGNSTTKRRGILGKSDRLLTIEDDYVHISTINNNHHQQTLTNNTSSSSTTINT
ncbi:hypothetical protein KEM48_006073 [Puccinia striiformis f. sp. tritici PST-130]|nr:hypothetical protein KEM48_006073 [Puccinia striiformis f. sp. tritici PST-130]